MRGLTRTTGICTGIFTGCLAYRLNAAMAQKANLLALIGLLCLNAPSTSGQEPLRKLTLQEALETALAHHPSLVRANAQVGIAGARVQQAQAGMLPIIVVQGVATDGPLGAPAFGPIGNPAIYGALPLSVQGLAGDPVKKQFGGGLNINQTLLDFGRTQHLVAARRELKTAAQEDANTQKALVLLGVQQAYLNVLRARQIANVQQENLRQRQATVQQAQLFVQAQLKAGVDLQLAQANAADAGVALLAAQGDAQYAFAVLNNAMGATTLTAYQLDPAPALPPVEPKSTGTDGATPPLREEEAVRRALLQRPELQAATRQLAASDQTIRGVRSERLPRLDAIVSLGVVNPSGVIKNSKDYAVGVALSVPLYTGGLLEGREAEEKQRREAAIAQERELQETIKLQVARAWLDVQTRQAQALAAQEQITSANTSLQLASERYRLQLNTLVELTDAESLTIHAQAALVNAQYDLELARAVLDWATGETYRRIARPAGTRTGGSH